VEPMLRTTAKLLSKKARRPAYCLRIEDGKAMSADEGYTTG
jgi:hypothetical protein